MSRWFRHYAGMMRDDKLVSAAVRAKQPVERVVWVWGAILESACDINDRGKYEIDSEEAAYFLRCGADEIEAILAAFENLGRINSGLVARWADRQFESDGSRERQKRYRDRQKTSRDISGDVTPPSRDAGVTAQETDTDTEKKVSRASARETDDWPKDFEERFWEVVPLKVGKDAAMRALGRVRRKRRCTFAKLIASMQRYANSVVGKERRFIKHPATWLNHGCYDDELEVMAPVVRLVTDTSKVRIPSEDPRWIPLADRYKREKGLWPPMGRDMAWDFPVEWVSDLSPLEAEAS